MLFLAHHCPAFGSPALSNQDEDAAYHIDDEEVSSGLGELEQFGGAPMSGAMDASGQLGEPLGEGEVALTEADKKAMNKSHAALLKVLSLSWPSEGAFGEKVSKGFPPNQPRRYSWLRAQRKAFQILRDSDMKARDSGPSEEVLLALGYRYPPPPQHTLPPHPSPASLPPSLHPSI